MLSEPLQDLVAVLEDLTERNVLQGLGFHGGILVYGVEKSSLMVGPEGIEPSTDRLKVYCSTN